MNKSILLSTIVILFSLSTLNAQFLSKGESQLQVGLGVGYLGFGAAYERAFQDDVTVGIYFSASDFGSQIYDWGLDRTISNPDFDLGVRGTYHFSSFLDLDPEKIDLYAALGAGLQIYRAYGVNIITFNGRPGFRVFPRFIGRIGGATSISDSMQAFGEIGRGPSWVTFGVNVKLGG